MNHLNKYAKTVMDKLTERLNGTARKIDKSGSKSIMAVHVEQVNQTPMGPVFSVTHFYEQNGDLMHDPDMTFLKGFTGEYFPLSYQQDNLGIYQEVVVEWKEDGTIKSYRPKLSADLTSFANTWMRNIKEQQNL